MYQTKENQNHFFLCFIKKKHKNYTPRKLPNKEMKKWMKQERNVFTSLDYSNNYL